jgi:hypothetical protein
VLPARHGRLWRTRPGLGLRQHVLPEGKTGLLQRRFERG